jgi:lipoprotein signal peptidase
VVSFTLVAGLSFIFIYEAIYKWSFYLAPFRMHMPPAEFREFVIQSGIAATILTGFAVGFFKLKKWTFIWLGLFVILYVFWLLIGLPQITGESFFHRSSPSALRMT